MIPATVRDATYVLDAILDNETDLTIVEHAAILLVIPTKFFASSTCWTAVAPRLRDLGDQQLYRMSREQQSGRLDIMTSER